MQPTRFDALTRVLAQTRTRCGALRVLGGAVALIGPVHRGHAAAVKPGSVEDFADTCRLAGGIPAPRLDGGINCVLDNGFEIHCDASGRCKLHCWPEYGCSCEHADVCHRSFRPGLSPKDPISLPDSATVLLSTGGAGGSTPEAGDSASPRRKRRKRRKRNRRRR